MKKLIRGHFVEGIRPFHFISLNVQNKRKMFHIKPWKLMTSIFQINYHHFV